MTEDDGYETIVPDLSGVKVEKTDYDAAQIYADLYSESDSYSLRAHERIAQTLARHRQAAYNQALKDAAGVVMQAQDGDKREWCAKVILSLGGKSNG